AHDGCEGGAPPEELGERYRELDVEAKGTRPAFAGVQHFAVAETTLLYHALHVSELDAAGEQIGHVDIVGLEAGLVEGPGHFHLAVAALLAQNGHARSSAAGDIGCGYVFLGVERHAQDRKRVV